MEKQVKNNSKSDNFLHLKQYSKFSSVPAMDTAVKQHKHLHYKVLNNTDKAVLDCLARHSLRHVGVSQLLSTTILEEINKTSSKTVTRVTQKLAKLNIIEIHKTKKMISTKTMNLRGANIFVILPFEEFCDEKNCLNENVPTKMSQRTIDEKPQADKVLSNNFKQESLNSLSSNSLEKNSLKNTYRVNNVSSKEKKELYVLLEQMYRSHEYNTNKTFNEFIMIIGNSYNKYVELIGLETLQNILTNTMSRILRSTNVKSDFKLYSHLVKKAIEELLESQKTTEVSPVVNLKQPNYKSPKGRTEVIPDWFHSRNESTKNKLNNQDQLNFELARKQLFEKHGDLFKSTN